MHYPPPRMPDDDPPHDAANQAAFDAPAAIRDFASMTDLQPPEARILQILAPRLPKARMLDLGVGGGRTTLHFAPRVQSYVGLDYAEGMVRACERRFAGREYRFVHGDARALPFDAEAFDVVVFSYNGIDYVSHADRERILDEIRRVLSPAGQFVFSTHNLGVAERLYVGEGGLLDRLKRRRIRARNPPLEKVRAQDHALLFDGACRGRLTTYYIGAAAQVRQLVAHGFAGTRIFGLATGAELSAAAAEAETRDAWLTYLCDRA